MTIIHLRSDEREQLRRTRCFFRAESEMAGCGRFYCADPRFPVSVALPAASSHYHYDATDPVSLHVEFGSDGGDLFIGRLDLPLTVEQGRFEAMWARQVVDGRRDEVWFTEEREKLGQRALGRRRYRIERNSLAVGRARVSRIVFEDGQRAFFLTRDDALWNVGTEALDDPTFRRVLGSLRFLSDEFYTGLGMT